jgi:hypothetical protein
MGLWYIKDRAHAGNMKAPYPWPAPGPNSHTFFKVTAVNPNHYGIPPITFIIEATCEETAIDCVKRAIMCGILLPNSYDGAMSAWPTYFQSRAIQYLLDGEFVAEELKAMPTMRFFPDVSKEQEWLRYQLSWYGRLAQDIMNWLVAARVGFMNFTS